ncbi:MAG: chorismate mutase [Acidobacteriota bacterium]|jgi:chorismate mutase/prephenate dehydratase|nr:chorismate mutase [Bryobacteraceae bacterium CoA2 C42]MCA2963154.1 chorismate mutase [Acidobacteriaceae bacterium]MCA2972200.1 chorismate mutase [Acidobacteriaceae bacterium]
MTPDEARAALAVCRAEIDEVDRRLVALINERVRVVERIGQIKQSAAFDVYEPNRERAVLENVAAANGGPLPADSAVRIFERIMDEMRTIQRNRMLSKEN